jgi:hypothetical protein
MILLLMSQACQFRLILPVEKGTSNNSATATYQPQVGQQRERPRKLALFNEPEASLKKKSLLGFQLSIYYSFLSNGVEHESQILQSYDGLVMMVKFGPENS